MTVPTAQADSIKSDSQELIAYCVLTVTKHFNSIVTEGRSREEDFPVADLPSMRYPEFALALDAIPLLLSKFVSLPSMETDTIVKHLAVISMSMAVCAKDAFCAHRERMQSGFTFREMQDEEGMVQALSHNGVIKGLNIPFKLVKNGFSDHKRPKADNPKQDLELQLAMRLYLYTAARWFGAPEEKALKICDQHMKVSWSMVMYGMWEKALEKLEAPKQRGRASF